MAGSLCVDHSTTFFFSHPCTNTYTYACKQPYKRNTHAHMQPHVHTHTHTYTLLHFFFDKHDSLPADCAGLQINATFLFCHFGLDDWI